MNMSLATTVIAWQKQHGRHDLPWQQRRSPYHVWISEVMLQQTQVKTVIPYYIRFMERCPSVSDLAQIPEDELLALWQGLGYYQRARNLQRAAKVVMDTHAGQFPDTHGELLALPGIGRSTAAAIMSLAYEKPDTILDGNVKRVLARVYGITDPINESKTLKTLWEIAEKNTTDEDPRAYTQGLMDLGASLCKRKQPLCNQCPLQQRCQAHQTLSTDQIPASKPKRKPKAQSLYLMMYLYNHQLGFKKRSQDGIWPNLYTPYLTTDPSHIHLDAKPLSPYQHQLTHLSLTIYPYVYQKHDPDLIYQPLDAITLPIPKGIQLAIDQLRTLDPS